MKCDGKKTKQNKTKQKKHSAVIVNFSYTAHTQLA